MTQVINMADYAHLSQGELIQKLHEMQAANTRLKAATQRRITLKVSEKGAVSAYGLGRFPVTLYADSWAKLLAEKDNILAFIEDNRTVLSFKD